MRVHTLDLQFRQLSHAIAAYLVESDGELALVETGPSTCLAALDEEIRRLGHEPVSVRKVFLTHIHLDHAGAAGHWAERGAEVFVHERGARHLADPSRLIEGARAVYGDRLETLWGDILPVPEAQLTPLREGDAVTVGSTRFAVWDAPGHARHHLVFVANRSAFTGDNAGVRLPGCTFLPPRPLPHEFDPEALQASVQRLRAANLERLYLTHFGVIEGAEEVAAHLDRYADLIAAETARIQHLVQEGLSPEQIGETFTRVYFGRAQAEGVSEEDWLRYETANPASMCAEGIRLWETARMPG